MEKKYKLTEESIKFNGKTLYRIESLRDFGTIKKGDKGGFIESERNLSHEGHAWVSDNAKVFGNACVSGKSKVYGEAKVWGFAKISGNSEVYGNANVSGYACVSGKCNVYDNAIVCGDADVCGYALICGDACIKGDRDYIVFKNWWSSGRYFTWTRSNNMWRVGCFYGSGEELIKKAYKDSEKSGREYERVVKYVESILGN